MSNTNQLLRILSIDAGNKDVKAILGELKNKISFPNVLSPLPENRNITDDYLLDDDDSQMKNLHFRVKSNALDEKFNNKVFGAGYLAMQNKKGKIEIPERTVKATNDQILI